MLLAAIALTVSLAFGAPGSIPFSAQAASPHSQLPATQPGLSRNEGVFLVTAADDGSRLVYFIAQNSRHSVLPGDLQNEQQMNSLWPVRLATREEVLAFPEGAPVGSARSGLLSGPVTAADEPPVAAEAPVVAEPPVAAEAPVVADAPVVAEAPVVAAAPPAASGPAVYVLQRGDNLTHLSTRYSTSIDAILAANGLTDANRIYIGQALVIPGAGSASEEILAAPEPVADAPATSEDVTYTVKRGDSAIHIARDFGVDVDVLLAANGVADRNRVYIGQVLTIPMSQTL